MSSITVPGSEERGIEVEPTGEETASIEKVTPVPTEIESAIVMVQETEAVTEETEQQST